MTAARLARNFPGSELGTDIAFASDLPRAAGMSSSSALIVGIAIALSYAGRLRERPEWQADVRSIVDEAGYLGCVENGRAFGALTGDAGVGTHGGSEDHAAMLAGTAGACSEFAFVPLRLVDTVSIPPAWTFVVASSGIGSHKTGSERRRTIGCPPGRRCCSICGIATRHRATLSALRSARLSRRSKAARDR